MRPNGTKSKNRRTKQISGDISKEGGTGVMAQLPEYTFKSPIYLVCIVASQNVTSFWIM